MSALHLSKAIAIAAAAHQNATDRGGKAYILHPLRVMMRLRTEDDELMQIAVLHDVVEDSPTVTLNTLITDNFSARVIRALRLLTHDKTEPYDEYIRRVASSRDAALVKLEDLRDNADITRLKGLREKDFERIEKYHRAFVYLRDSLATMEKVGYSS